MIKENYLFYLKDKYIVKIERKKKGKLSNLWLKKGLYKFMDFLGLVNLKFCTELYNIMEIEIFSKMVFYTLISRE